MDELVDVAVKAFSGRRPTEPDDDLLFALLSHQVLAVRQSMLDFAQRSSPASTTRYARRFLRRLGC